MSDRPSALDQIIRHWHPEARPFRDLLCPNSQVTYVNIQNVVDYLNARYAPGDPLPIGIVSPPWDTFLLFWVDTHRRDTANNGPIYMAAVVESARTPDGWWTLIVRTFQYERGGHPYSFASGGGLIYVSKNGLLESFDTPSGPIEQNVLLCGDWDTDSDVGMVFHNLFLNTFLESRVPQHVMQENSDAARAAVDECRSIFNHEITTTPWRQDSKRDMIYVIQALLFANCKNVIARDRGVTSPPVRWVKEGHPRFRYKILSIATKSTPTDDPLMAPDESWSGTRKKSSLHFVRGHFMVYTPEKPMFGKYVGQFWVPQHTRGTTESGVVIKDYSIDPKDGDA